MKTLDELKAMSVSELESHLDAERETKGRDYLKSVMAVRNRKIKEAEMDHWALSEEAYDAAIAKANARGLLELEIVQVRKERSKTDIADAAKLVELSDREAALLELSRVTPAVPKHTHLNNARSAALKEFRKAQTAKADAATVQNTVEPA